MNDSIDHAALASAIAGFRTVMLTSVGSGGRLHSRPLPLLEVDGEGTLWFFMDRTSQLAIDVLVHTQVAVIATRTEVGTYIAVSGHAVVRNEPALVRELWHEAYRCWFPRQIEESQLTMLCVLPDDIQSWTGLGLATGGDSS